MIRKLFAGFFTNLAEWLVALSTITLKKFVAVAGLLAIVITYLAGPLMGFAYTVLVGLSVVTHYILRYILTDLAKRHFPVTFRKEGEVVPIMVGEKCDKYLMAVDNHLIDPIDFDIHKGDYDSYKRYLAAMALYRLTYDPTFIESKLEFPTKDGRIQVPVKQVTVGTKNVWVIDHDRIRFKRRFLRELKAQNEQTLLEKLYGVAWVGLPPRRVFRYDFSWMKYAQEKSKTGEPSKAVTMHPKRDPAAASLYFRYTQYGIEIEDAETGASEEMIKNGGGLERIGVRLLLVIETETVNPQKTLFRTAGISSAGEWLSAISREIRHLARMKVGDRTYDDLIRDDTGVRKMLNGIRDEVNAEEAIKEIVMVPAHLLVGPNGGLTDPVTVALTGNEITVRKKEAAFSSVFDSGQRIKAITLVNVDLLDTTLQAHINKVFEAEQQLRAAGKEAARKKTLAEGDRAEAAAKLLGEADGYAAIAAAGGERMKIASEIGKIRVFAPGNTGMFLNVAADVADAVTPPPATPASPPPVTPPKKK